MALFRRARAMLLLWACGALPVTALADTAACRVSFDQGRSLRMPLAATADERALGLSGRDDIGPGMLFAWKDSAVRELWMKDTRVPLSAAFIDADGVVRRLVDMQPYSLQRHSSIEPIRYIVELAKGDFARLGVTVGSRVGIDCPG
ncbi:DUF192 domain-containing protein [Phytopseudomonas dryadis]|uniref:DUF192 domain-containing protein n=1 Tax=Phytopseudomonas dryadis TaxID=2487520 RepID=A0A4Q9QT80_9GAMM|nr:MULTISPECIES: DUF192 domain-containing protein [Pseudomonas]TBU85220.1 hypothetical protein DNK44_24405 [Pseudomonas dryadis]TBV04055.1 hypothetical protein DNK34_15020 [Pseudomonas dryadis]TBV17053.1 hypothetical protein DNK41_14390 [Pseudomonas sp. FRB 230]